MLLASNSRNTVTRFLFEILHSLFWVFVGYRLAHWLWLLSEVGVSEKGKHES